MKETIVSINTKYLVEIIAKSGKLQTEFSESLGKSEAYISVCKKKKRMSKAVAMLICQMYDADFEKLTTPDEVQKREDPENGETSDDLIVKFLESITEKHLRLYDEITVLKEDLRKTKEDLQILKERLSEE